MSTAEDGEAPDVPRHLAPKRSRFGRLPVPGIVAGALLVVALGAGMVLVGGSSSDDGDGGDRIAATGSRPDAPSDAAGDSAGGEIPSVERPARPAGAPVLLDVAPSPPVGIEIPVLGITSTLEDLAIAPDGELGAPVDFGKAGWFVDGPQPGQPGPAVIAGHVDSQAGPAIFYRLSELRPGSVVLVHREDGTTVTFSVVETEQYPKDAFPSTRVYGPTPGPELRLITCGGVFDAAAHSYRDNVVVYATALPS